ncbi:hypothetical protein CAPTEDRAFT_219288 [Capitella teleta]|uniref:alpha-1,2-Mannosidase n=1 Tax=Capitella teleta TaxID=283909 RepID=R7TQT7_CAPTE|nr:hypothetical protein CAPTEDRAFT_219288 [Capitella teleta]|eukprot:ELT95927.1 hypothetical protein CAPTEDRAFT_219288 [Capitella teleta]
MESAQLVRAILLLAVFVTLSQPTNGMSLAEKRVLREKTKEMFQHAYGSYMDNAYPADELMPLSCKGRYRETQPSRGDIDDSLGNFSLTLIDTLDTLVLLGEIAEFERAVKLVIKDVSFDSDLVVSVFETNIRILGGLLGGHAMADVLKKRGVVMQWYNNELLDKALDVGFRLLPAFNTSTGIPYPKVNLRHGVNPDLSRTGREKDTCTACAGTMILEFSALSRLSGESIFEEKASKAMEYLWRARHRSSDLVGTVINIHNGDWVRRESGVGAGIDSYYEYLMKAYILLGDETYLHRFNKHYRAIKKYINQGPLLLDVHMHRPLTNTRNFMDSLLAFWPGLQVLKGDLKSAIEIHEMLFQVMQRHSFLPEAFTSDFRVHWAHHPLRPEFLESTYFIYKATGDPHYLEVGRMVLENLEAHARVLCGFAAIKDVTTLRLEDQMDSYLLAETFKYLYLLFSEKEDLIIDIDEFVFTTEAHLLPLSHSLQTHPNASNQNPDYSASFDSYDYDLDEDFDRSCPNNHNNLNGNHNFAQNLREPLQNMVQNLCPSPKSERKPRIRASEFMAGNPDQLVILAEMGIKIVTMSDGRVQLLHTAAEAKSSEEAEEGMVFMQEMIELSKSQAQQVQHEPRVVQLLSHPYLGNLVLNAGPAQFGSELKNSAGLEGGVVKVDPYSGCGPVNNYNELKGKIGIVQRGDCMFVEKARNIQTAGGIGGIVVDNSPESSSDITPLFAMSGDGTNDIQIPMVFVFDKEAQQIFQAIQENIDVQILLGYRSKRTDDVMRNLLQQKNKSKGSREIVPEDEATTLLLEFLNILALDTLGLGVRDVWNAESVQREQYAQKNGDSEMVYVDDETLEEKELDAEARGRLLCSELIKSLKKQTNFDEVISEEEQLAYQQAMQLILGLKMSNTKEEAPQEMLDLVRFIASRLTLEKIAISTSDTLSQEIDDVLEDYIHKKLDEVVMEAEETVHKAEGERRTVPVDLLERMQEDRKRGKQEGLLGKFLPPNVQAAPAWMQLKPGEIYVDEDGMVFASLKADEFIDKSRQEKDSNGKVYYRVSSRTDSEDKDEDSDTFDLGDEVVEERRSYLEDGVRGPSTGEEGNSGASFMESSSQVDKDEL